MARNAEARKATGRKVKKVLLSVVAVIIVGFACLLALGFYLEEKDEEQKQQAERLYQQQEAARAARQEEQKKQAVQEAEAKAQQDAAAKAQQGVESMARQEVDAGLPFVGTMEFNFSGGTATQESITIEKDGRATIQMCGDAGLGGTCRVEYSGPYKNSMKTQEEDQTLAGYGWSIRGKQIIQLRNDAPVQECGDDGHQVCMAELSPTDGGAQPSTSEAASAHRPAADSQETAVVKADNSVDLEKIAADQEREWNAMKIRIDPMINPSFYVKGCVEKLEASAVRNGMSREQASAGIPERCEKLVSEFRECASLSPGRPKRCNKGAN